VPFGNSGGDLIEDEYREPYSTWKADPSPVNNSAILKTLTPAIDGAIRTHVGAPNPLLVSRARKLALDGLPSYDPARGRLTTHVYNQLLGLKRVSRQQGSILKVPERVAQDRYVLGSATDELAHELGRDPTDDEVADRTGFSVRRMARVREYNPAVSEGSLEASNPETMEVLSGTTIAGGRKGMPAWHGLVYDDLSTQDRKIMEYAFGLNGRRPMSNLDIAAKLGRSPGLISQRKLFIQQLLDQEQELSPF